MMRYTNRRLLYFTYLLYPAKAVWYWHQSFPFLNNDLVDMEKMIFTGRHRCVEFISVLWLGVWKDICTIETASVVHNGVPY